jgi:hypothetical protein
MWKRWLFFFLKNGSRHVAQASDSEDDDDDAVEMDRHGSDDDDDDSDLETYAQHGLTIPAGNQAFAELLQNVVIVPMLLVG